MAPTRVNENRQHEKLTESWRFWLPICSPILAYPFQGHWKRAVLDYAAKRAAHVIRSPPIPCLVGAFHTSTAHFNASVAQASLLKGGRPLRLSFALLLFLSIRILYWNTAHRVSLSQKQHTTQTEHSHMSGHSIALRSAPAKRVLSPTGTQSFSCQQF